MLQAHGKEEDNSCCLGADSTLLRFLRSFRRSLHTHAHNSLQPQAGIPGVRAKVVEECFRQNFMGKGPFRGIRDLFSFLRD
jgi:hypothetical protein